MVHAQNPAKNRDCDGWSKPYVKYVTNDYNDVARSVAELADVDPTISRTVRSFFVIGEVWKEHLASFDANASAAAEAPGMVLANPPVGAHHSGPSGAADKPIDVDAPAPAPAADSVEEVDARSQTSEEEFGIVKDVVYEP